MKKRSKVLILVLSLIVITLTIFVVNLKPTASECPSSDFSILSINELNQICPNILNYKKIHDRIKLNFTPFPIAISEDSTDSTPIIPETFILRIAKGSVYSDKGYVIVDKKFMVNELIWPWSPIKKQGLSLGDLPKAQKVNGRLLILTQEGHRFYYHWLAEVLPKLALVQDMSYDWVYLSINCPFQMESLQLLGIDASKIISVDENTHIEADEIIVPSYVSRSCYTPEWVACYLRERLLDPVLSKFNPISDSSKIFISREKAFHRRVINEEEIFNLLKPLGYQKYFLEDLSFTEQMLLFSQAKHIVACHGAGLTNIVFCRPGTQIIELFQEHDDDTYCYLSQTMKLHYNCLKTTEFRANSNYRYNDTSISPELFKQFIEDNIHCF